MTMLESTTVHLPALPDDYAVSPEQIAAFQSDGHVLLRGVLSEADVAAYRGVITDAAKRYSTETRAIEDRDTYGKAFLQIENLWVRDCAVARFTLARRFAKIAAELMGVSSVRIYHDQALFKEPGGGPTPFHQDQYYWPLDTTKTVTMWMPLVPVTDTIGSMTFASGSQSLGYVGDFEISDESEAQLQTLIEQRGLRKMTYGAMRPGDTTWHAGWTLHGAPANPTGTLREVMTIIYMDADARVIAPDSDARKSDLENWLNCAAPGEPAAGPLNPVVY